VLATVACVVFRADERVQVAFLGAVGSLDSESNTMAIRGCDIATMLLGGKVAIGDVVWAERIETAAVSMGIIESEDSAGLSSSSGSPGRVRFM